MNELSNELSRYKFIIENIKDMIWEMNTDFIYTFVSPTAFETTGYQVEELVGTSMLDYLTQESRENILVHTKINELKRINGELRTITLYDLEFISKNGSMIWFEVSSKPIFQDGKIVGYIGSARDISEKKEYENELKIYISELKKTNVKLNELATMDTLTGAYNRRNFEHYFTESALKKEKFDTPFSIIMFDLDHFKQINDQYGHNKGDHILLELADLVRHTVRDSDLLFRWGGDEFIILLAGVKAANAYKVAEKVRKAVESYHFGLPGNDVTVSMGVGEYQKGDSVYQFVACTDSALLKAKATGRNRVEHC